MVPAASRSGCDAVDFPARDRTRHHLRRLRGVCDRVDKPLNGQAAGGIAVIMVNTADDYPPFEGAVPGLTIPFLGVTSASGPLCRRSTGRHHHPTGRHVGQPVVLVAGRTSRRVGRGLATARQKPDVIAPGVGVMSAGLGSGTGGIELSGTSMASPHTAGIAALDSPDASEVVDRDGQGRHRRHRDGAGRRVRHAHRRQRCGQPGRRDRDRHLL